MARTALFIALGTIAAATPATASIQDPAPAPAFGAPAGTPDTLYCMRIEAIIGSRLEKVKCWTRQQWADNEVDVDKDWAEEGVAVIPNGARRPSLGLFHALPAYSADSLTEIMDGRGIAIQGDPPVFLTSRNRGARRRA